MNPMRGRPFAEGAFAESRFTRTVCFAVLPIISSFAIVFWAFGNRSTGEYAPIIDVRFLDDHSGVVAIFGAISLALDCALVTAAKATTAQWSAIGISIVTGAWFAFALRLASASVHGANIGGGMAIAASVPVALISSLLLFVLLRTR